MHPSHPPVFAPTAAPAQIEQGCDIRHQLLRSLLADRGWQCEAGTRERLRRLLSDTPVHPSEGETPPPSQESDWSLLAHELECYLDFRRLRQIEAQLRGCAIDAFVFGRAEWQQARHSEQALRLHLRQVRADTYIPPAADRFRVH